MWCRDLNKKSFPWKEKFAQQKFYQIIYLIQVSLPKFRRKRNCCCLSITPHTYHKSFSSVNSFIFRPTAFYPFIKRHLQQHTKTFSPFPFLKNSRKICTWHLMKSLAQNLNILMINYWNGRRRKSEIIIVTIYKYFKPFLYTPKRWILRLEWSGDVDIN